MLRIGKPDSSEFGGVAAVVVYVGDGEAETWAGQTAETGSDVAVARLGGTEHLTVNRIVVAVAGHVEPQEPPQLMYAQPASEAEADWVVNALDFLQRVVNGDR